MDHKRERDMRCLITYGSKYGSTKHYAKKFADITGFPVMPYSEVKSGTNQELIIHFGALYAGGVLGLKSLVSKISPDTKLVIVTVGLADVQDAGNIKNIRKSIRSQLTEELFDQSQIFHLRGAINYEILNFKHKTMMAMLYAKVKMLPEERQNAETKALIATYGKKVSFVDTEELERVLEAVRGAAS